MLCYHCSFVCYSFLFYAQMCCSLGGAVAIVRPTLMQLFLFSAAVLRKHEVIIELGVNHLALAVRSLRADR